MSTNIETYVSTDVETDGPIPGPNSMLSLGAAAYTADKRLLGTFSRNLVELPNAKPDPATAAWWQTQPAAWQACRQNTQDPARVMKEYVEWVNALPGRPVFVGYPVGFDFMFTYWYLIYFTGASPFSFSALDIKTYAMAVMGTSYRDSSKKNMPSSWFDKKLPHTHKAVDDAMGQGVLFCNALAARNKKMQGR